MKEKFVYILVCVFFLSSVLATSYTEDFSVYKDVDSSSLQIDLLKYEPYPTNPGEYFDLWILVYKSGSGKEDVSFELESTYPFSLDSNEDAFRYFSGVPGESILLEYKVRVDEDAVEGDNTITLRYRLGENAWAEKDFDIYVSDAQTSFDGVIQDIDGESISLALANTGKNVANSVIVRVPDQEGFSAIGTSGQMVGNLDDGDYTIVAFDVQSTGRSDTIKFQVDYTDSIDERRSTILELPLDMNSNSDMMPFGNQSAIRGPVSTNESSSMNYVWILVLLFVLFVVYRMKDKIKSFFVKKKSRGKPDWMKEK